MLKYHRFPMLLAVAMLLAAGTVSAVVAPNPASLLAGKKILMIRGTDATTSEHGGARVALNAKMRQLRDLIGFQLDTANALTNGAGYQAAGSGTLLPLESYDIIFFNYWFHSANAGTLGTFQANFKNWTNNTAKLRGWLGVHTSGANEFNEWNWFRDSVSAMGYRVHAGNAQAGTIHKTTDTAVLSQPIMAGLPDTMRIPADEWYDFSYVPLFADAKVLYYLDEASLPTALPTTASMNPHPSSWFRQASNGNRYFYTALVHNASGVNLTSGNDYYISMMLRALEYLAGYQTTPISINGNGVYKNQKSVLYMTNGELKIDSKDAYKMEVRSMQGKLLYSGRGKGQQTYRLDALQNAGFYVVKIAGKSGIYSQRVMIR